MRRVIRWTLIASTLLAAWASTLQFVEIKKPYFDIVLALPLLALIGFGCYSLAVIAYNLMTFPECAAEAAALEKDRAAATADLKKRGFRFDDEPKKQK